MGAKWLLVRSKAIMEAGKLHLLTVEERSVDRRPEKKSKGEREMNRVNNSYDTIFHRKVGNSD